MNASATESADDAITVRIPRLIRRCCVILLYVLAAFWGVAQIVSSANGLIYILSALLFATAATYAAIEDSRLLRIQFVRILQVLFFFTWPIASLIYLVVTRGWRGFGWWCLHAVGLFATMCLTFYPTYILLYSLRLIDVDQ